MGRALSFIWVFVDKATLSTLRPYQKIISLAQDVLLLLLCRHIRVQDPEPLEFGQP